MKVIGIPPKHCYEWILKKHYAHRIPSISFAYGLYDTNHMLRGVCTYGTPPSPTLLRGVCGEEYKKYVLELNRLVCVNEHNIASYFVARTLKLLPKPRIIVSYADGSKGHTGYVYQACNFIYTGLSTLTYDPVVKGQEHKHHTTSGVGRGLTKATMKEIFGDNVHWAARDRKHRYIYIIGDRTFKREALKALTYKILPYPKGNNRPYDVSYELTGQGALI